MSPLPELADLVAVFDGEPTNPYAEEERRAGYELDYWRTWPYTRLVFSARRGARQVELDLEPGYHTLRLKITDGDGSVVDVLVHDQVAGLQIDRHDGRELIGVDLGEWSRGRSLWLMLRPHISVAWELGTVH